MPTYVFGETVGVNGVTNGGMVSADDQHILRSNVSWAAIVDGSATLTRNTNGTRIHARHFFDGTTYFVTDGLLRWDTSAIPDAETVVSATLRAAVDTASNADGNRLLCADWNSWDGTSATDWTITAETGALTNSAYSGVYTLDAVNDIPLENAAANVNKTGYTRLRLHLTGGTTAPTGSNQFWLYSLDDAVLPEPQLVVVTTIDEPVGEPGDPNFLRTMRSRWTTA